jgi:hypothetical protein
MTGRARCCAFAPGSSEECGPGWPAVLPGPLCGGESGSTGRAAGVDMDVGSFSPGQDALSKSPAPAHGLAAQGWAASAKRGGLSLWLSFSLATQRESNSASEGGRKLFALAVRDTHSGVADSRRCADLVACRGRRYSPGKLLGVSRKRLGGPELTGSELTGSGSLPAWTK